MILAHIIAENEAWLLVSVIFYLPNLPRASTGRESASFTHFLHVRGAASPQAGGTSHLDGVPDPTVQSPRCSSPRSFQNLHRKRTERGQEGRRGSLSIGPVPPMACNF